MDELIRKGITAYKAGFRDEARQIFIKAVKQSPDNEVAWGWMYQLSNDDRERNQCLKQMLRINPENNKAKHLLDLINAKSSTAASVKSIPPRIRQSKPINPAHNKMWGVVIIGLSVVLLISAFGLYSFYKYLGLSPDATLEAINNAPTKILLISTITPSPIPIPSFTQTPSPTSKPTSTSTPVIQRQIISAENVVNLSEVLKFNAPGKREMSINWSSDNKRLSVENCRFGGDRFTPPQCVGGRTIFDPFTGEIIRQIQEGENVQAGGSSGNGRIVGVYTSFAPFDWKGYLLDVDTGKKIGTLTNSLQELNDAGNLAVYDEGYGYFLADLSSNKTVQSFEIVPDFYSLGYTILSQDGNLLGVVNTLGGSKYYFQLWNTTAGQALINIPLIGNPINLSFSSDGTRVMGYFSDSGIGEVCVWDSSTGQIINRMKWTWPTEFSFPEPAISPNGLMLARQNVEIVQNRPTSVIQLVNIENEDVLLSIEIPNNDVGIVSFSGDGRWLAYASSSETNSEQWIIHILAVSP